ncbi:MAG: glycosyltransferase family 39 protein [Sedimentisphaerales bacterium]|nr:glycosyltransferase family 39 protein [Sedimentisphaerales bacterium]
MLTDKKKLISDTMTEKDSQWPTLFLYLVAFFLLFWGLGGRSLWGSEGRWAEVTREMLLTKDFFHPTIGGEPYYDKPLLTYWLIAALVGITGILNEWIVRIPSAFFGLVTVWATVQLGRRLWSPRVGRLAGWLVLTSYGLIFWSRTAAADTENLAAITLCILWYWARRDRPGFVTFFIFYLIAFLGALTKGLTAVVIPIVAILPDLLREKRWKHLLRISHLLALVLAGGIYLGPFVYSSMSQTESYQSSGLALVFQENILRFFNPIDHKNPFYIYFYAVPLLILPWAPIWVASLAGMLPIWKELDKKTRWLIAAMGMIFLFFTLSGSRREYYILPIIPLCALCMAVFLIHIVHERTVQARAWGITIQKYLGTGLILCEIGLPFVLLFLKMRNHFEFFIRVGESGIIVAIAVCLGQLLADRWTARHNKGDSREVQSMAGLIAITTIVFAGFFLWQQPIIDTYRTERPFIEEVKARSADWPTDSIGFFPKNDAKLLFYLGKTEPIHGLKTASDWDHFVSAPGAKLLIMQRKYEEKVPPEYQHFLQMLPDIEENTQPWDSVSSRRKKWRVWILPGQPDVMDSITKREEVPRYAN